jgi:DNA modification methylase
MNWQTQKRKLSDLTLLDNNPRTISADSFDKLGQDLDRVGNFRPLVIDTKGVILAGNQRYRQLLAKYGRDYEVDVSVPEKDLTEAQRKQVIILDNKHRGEDDIDVLANEYEDTLKELGFDDLLPDAGFDVDEDDYVEPDDLEVKVKPGDVYVLGEHRMVCGDSTKIDDLDKLMDGKKARMVFTDPPYNISYEGMAGNKRREILNDSMSSEDFKIFLRDAFANISQYTLGAFYVCMSTSELHTLRQVMDEIGVVWKSYIVWVKDRFGLSGADYQKQFEPITYGMKNEYFKELVSRGEEDEEGDALYYGKKGSEYFGGRKQSDVWFIPKPTVSKEHPTMKPIRLCAKAILNSSKQEDIVMDTFGGSGSTLMACEQTNRRCYIMELDPYYCQVIIDRWETYTGKEAVLNG